MATALVSSLRARVNFVEAQVGGGLNSDHVRQEQLRGALADISRVNLTLEEAVTISNAARAMTWQPEELTWRGGPNGMGSRG